MTNNISFVTDATGRLHAGMTLKEAQAIGVDKSFWRRDFHNLDKNNDGVLSVKEVMDERNRSSKLNKWLAVGFAALGVIDVISNRGSKGWLIFDLLLDGFLILTSLSSAYKTDRGTEQIATLLTQQNKDKKLQLNA